MLGRIVSSNPGVSIKVICLSARPNGLEIPTSEVQDLSPAFTAMLDLLRRFMN